MAKQNRGKILARLASRGRGTCPVCFTTRTKLLYKRKKSDGGTLLICKKCINISAEKLDQVNIQVNAIAFRRKHRKAYNRLIEQAK